MSKLATIKHALETNPDMIIVEVEQDFPQLPHFSSLRKKRNRASDINIMNILDNLRHTVDYFVAPKNGLYSVDELQTFMNGLIPDMPAWKTNFRFYSDPEITSEDDIELYGSLRCGSLYFTEKIGEERRIIEKIITDEELLNTLHGSEFVDGKLTTVEDVKDYCRGIWIRVYPNLELAEHCLVNNRRYIGPEDLKKHGLQGLLQ